MRFHTKFKMNLHHEHFPKALKKYTPFPKFIPLFSISRVRTNGEAHMRLSLLLVFMESEFSCQ